MAEFLIGMLVALLFVMVIGHLLWVAAAALLRLLFGRAAQDRPVEHCPSCQCPMPPNVIRCRKCGQPMSGARAEEIRELIAAARQVHRLRDRHDLDEETALRVEQALLERRREIQQAGAKPLPSRLPPPMPAPPPPHRILPPATRQPEPELAEVLPVEEPDAAVPVENIPAVPVWRVVPVPVPETTTPPPHPIPAPRPAKPPRTPEPLTPRRSLATVLAAFMEDRNILWGELIGGLLIVGCSIALVISLRQSLEAVPYSPFLLFTAITASLFAAGKYTLHHWKLTTTSRGLLVIASLLTPLNLLMLGNPYVAGQSGFESGGVIDLSVKIVSLIAFSSLAYAVGGDLLAGASGPGWSAAIGVVGTVSLPLLGSALPDVDQRFLLLPSGAAAIVTQMVSLREPLFGGRARPRIYFTLLGISSFALLAALGFLVSQASEASAAVQHLGILLTPTGYLALLVGTRQGRVAGVEAAAPSDGWRTVASTVNGASLMLMLVGIALTWPNPVLVPASCILSGVLLAILAYRERSPAYHVAAFTCLAVAAVLGFHRIAGVLPESGLAGRLIAPESGAALAGYGLILLLASEVLYRGGRRVEAATYALGATAAALIGIGHVTGHLPGRPALAAAVYATCATGTLAGNYRWRRPVLAYAGLGLAVAAGLLLLQATNAGQWHLWALIAGTASTVFALANLRSNPARSGRAWRDVGVITGGIAVVLMAQTGILPLWNASTCTALAIAAVLLAIAGRSPAWFAVGQIAVAAAGIFAVNGWLRTQSWAVNPIDPRVWQAYGIGLGALSLAWSLARLTIRRWQLAAEIGLYRSTIDRWILAGVVVGQFALAIAAVLPGIIAEMAPAVQWSFPEVLVHAHGKGAGVILGLLVPVLALNLREAGRTRFVLGMMILCFTVPLLVAGRFEPDRAVATALRWSMAAGFMGISTVLWARHPLRQAASKVGISFYSPQRAVLVVRQALHLAAALVIALTVWLAVFALTRHLPALPSAASFFGRIGWINSAAAPLLLLVVGFVGHAVRDRAPGYSFVAGLLANMTLAGGYALAVVLGGDTIGESEAVRIGQLATLGFEAWGILWIAGRAWIYGRHARALIVLPAAAGPLLALQIALAIGGNLALLGGAVAIRGNVLIEPTPWSIEAGSALGAAALTAGLAALALWHLQRRDLLTWQAPFFIGLAIPVWLACASERSLSGSGSRVLVLVWPGYVLLWSLSALRPNWRRRLAPGVSFNDDELGVGVALASLFTSFLAVKTVWLLDGFVLAAMAALITAGAFVSLAIARRLEVHAFIAACLGNVAVSLIVARHYHELGLAIPLLSMVLANVVTSSVESLLWLVARRWLGGPVRPGPLLPVQAFLGLVFNTILLSVPVALLLFEPSLPLPSWLHPELPVSGWPALLLATFAAFTFCQQNLLERRPAVLGIFGFSAGALLACQVALSDSSGWLSYHVFSASVGALGLVTIIAGSISRGLHVAASNDGGTWFARWFADLFAIDAMRRGAELAGAALVALALRGAGGDPYRPYPSAAALLIVSVEAAGLALWLRRARYVWTSGLLFNLGGLALWQTFGSGHFESFLLANAVGLALAGGFWSAASLLLAGQHQLLPERGRPSFAYSASACAWLLVVVVTCTGLAVDLRTGARATIDPLARAALLSVAIALTVAVWEISAPGVVGGIYILGYCALGQVLHAAKLEPEAFARIGTVATAGYLLAASLVRRELTPALLQRLRLPARDGRWFARGQRVVAVLVAAAGGGLSVGLPAAQERLAGAAAVTIAAVAIALLGSAGRRWSLILTTIAAAEVALALPDPGLATSWLERTAALFAALTVAKLAYSSVLPLLLPSSSPWRSEAKHAGTATGATAVLTLICLLAQEIVLFDAEAGRTSMGSVGIFITPICILVLVVAAIRAALNSESDALGLPEKMRTGYVYGAEVLLLTIFVHLRVTAPELFSGWIAQYWSLVVMLLGFAGMGLSEWFERRGGRVLAEPLRTTGLVLPLVPLIAYWLPLPLIPAGAYPRDLGQYALLWLILSVLFGLSATLRHSSLLGFLSALALNFGLWSLLADRGVEFLAHPQVWLIPLALIVLVAEHFNRERLEPEVAAGLRYLGICSIYVSSTADLFIAGLGHSMILPVILAVLAVGGMLAGISLRVRAFLFFGFSFLLLVLMTMIWHAAVNLYHTWVWWVSGIVLGIAILAMFAVFEKRRNDVLRLLDELKRWN